MPTFVRPIQQTPDFWQVFGHSYYMHSFGGRSIMGRPDAIMRATLDIEYTNWQNYAVSGSRLAVEGLSQGGYARLYNAALQVGMKGWVSTTAGKPYVAYGGAKVIGHGLNDAGITGCSSFSQGAYMNAMRCCIALCRASRYHDTNSASIAYSGWTNIAGTQVEWALTQAGVRSATAAGTITFTIPADYQGTPITFMFNSFLGNASVVTFSGTAGVSGTFTGAGAVLTASPINFFNHSPLCKRITTLTAANAGQTIICTVTTLDTANGSVLYFDGILIEAVDPGPVLVASLNRIPSAGYSGSYGTPTDGVNISDANIAVWNTAIAAIVGEFDAMVRYTDIDAVIQSTGNPAELLSAADNLHPNELGAAAIADAYFNQLQAITPTTKYVKTTQLNLPSRRYGILINPRRSGLWYMQDANPVVSTTTYTAVSGDMFAVPFMETMPDGVWSNWAIELVASSVATVMRFAVYDDRGYSGYPQTMFNNLTAGATGFTLAASAGRKESPSSGAGSFVNAIAAPADPGMYWLVIKIDTAGTTTFRVASGPSAYMPQLPTATGAAVVNGYSGWKLTGQGTATLPNTFPSGGVPTDPCPIIGLKYT